MNKKRWLTLSSIASLSIVAVLFAFGIIRMQPDGGVTFFTSKTKDAWATQTDEKPMQQQRQASPEAKPRTTEYRQLQNDHFKKHADKQRLIFFKEAGHQPSDQVHAIFMTHINDFKKDIMIYRADFQEHKELASQLSITRPGSIVKFDGSGSIVAIYIAPEQPTVDQLRQVLAI